MNNKTTFATNIYQVEHSIDGTNIRCNYVKYWCIGERYSLIISAIIRL